MSNYRVHSAAVEPMPVAATTDDGRAVTAMVPGLVVELVPEGHAHGTITRRYTPADEAEMAALREKYAVGELVVVSTDAVAKGE